MAENLILEKLEGVKQRFDEVSKLVNEPDVMSDMKRYVALNKEFKELEPLIKTYEEYKNVLSNIDDAKAILKNESDEEKGSRMHPGKGTHSRACKILCGKIRELTEEKKNG